MSTGREAARRRATGDHTAATTGDTSPAGTMRQLLEQMKPELALALPRHMTPERMARQALTAFRTTPGLDKCTPASFLGVLMTCAQVGLEPGPQGHVYILPFEQRKNIGGTWKTVATNATFILGYQGMIELARRSGELVDIAAHTVYSNEVDAGKFTVQYGTNGGIRHEPIVFGDRGEPVGYYATATLKSGGRPFVVLSKADVDAFRLRSQTQRAGKPPSGPWMTDFEAMAWKTCVRRLARWLPQSPELAAALVHEESVRDVVPGTTTANVVDMQPPALENTEPDDMGADPDTGEIPGREIPAGTGQDDTPPEPEPDPWGEPAVPDPHDGNDPWSKP